MGKEISEDINRLYIVHNDNDSLYKLNELFKAMGLDITYDYLNGKLILK